MEKSANISDLKLSFLEQALPIVATSGWENAALERASLAMQRPTNYHQILFPRGIYQVLDFFEQTQDELMLSGLSRSEPPKGITAKVSQAIKLRISQVPKEILKHNQKVYLTARGMPLAATVTWRTADCIWNYCQDTSLDYNYYTKRTTLGLIYVLSCLYYIKDDSAGHQNTDLFIARLLAQINNIKYIKAQLKRFVQDLPWLRLFLQ